MKYTFLFCLFSLSTAIGAQSTIREWQLRVGVVRAYIADVTGRTNGIYKYSLGVFSETKKSESAWSLITGIELKGKGKGIYKKAQSRYEEQLDLQYLNLVAGQKWNNRKMNLCIGLFAGYLAGAENSLPANFADRLFDPTEVRKIDIGLIAGVGYRFFDFLEVGLNYDYSITPMYKRKIYGANLSSAYVYSRNRAISLYAGAVLKF
jgi:hypothetical protein